MATPEVIVRPWRRGDQRREQRWPGGDLPAHWVTSAYADSDSGGRRENWAIEAGGQLVGKITLRNFGRHSLPLPSARLGIYLRPGLYGQGVGTAALTAFFVVCPVSYLRLDVAADNRRAIGCYQRAGFRIFCHLWRMPVAYIEMERHLASNRAISLDALHCAAD